MTKKIIVAAIVLLVGAVVVKKANLCSYATAVFNNGAERVRHEIPRDLELARVKSEIGKMDRDYQKLLRAIAERMASTKKLSEEVAMGEANRKELVDSLSALAKAIEEKEAPIRYQGFTYQTTAKAEAKAARELTVLKQLDKSLASKKKMLDAEQRNLDALRDALDKLVTQKREFEVRVAQLEAAQAELDAVAVKSPLKTDESRVADIKRTLDEIEYGVNVDRQLIELQEQYGSKIDNSTANVQQPSAVNLQEIHDYLQGKAAKPAKVAQGK
jgi:chromosome segregation ATPase